MLANALTVDVEEHFQVAAFFDVVEGASWESHGSRVVANTRRLLELFDARSVKGTFFVLGWVAKRQPALVREIAAAGHEVASHGYSHQFIYRQTPEVFRQETERSKKLLEDLVQEPVRGYRAASYSITRRSLWALDILVECGFEYDSSIAPVRHDNYGIPDACPVPHRLRTPAGNEIDEFPISALRLPGFNLPVAGGGYFRLYPYAFSRFALRQVNRRQKTPFVFYLHPWEVDPEQPRIAASRLSTFRHYNNLERCEARLQKLLHDFRFAPMRDVLAAVDLPTVPLAA